jgi:hypothetical protein
MSRMSTPGLSGTMLPESRMLWTLNSALCDSGCAETGAVFYAASIHQGQIREATM